MSLCQQCTSCSRRWRGSHSQVCQVHAWASWIWSIAITCCAPTGMSVRTHTHVHALNYTDIEDTNMHITLIHSCVHCTAFYSNILYECHTAAHSLQHNQRVCVSACVCACWPHHLIAGRGLRIHSFVSNQTDIETHALPPHQLSSNTQTHSPQLTDGTWGSWALLECMEAFTGSPCLYW